MTRRSRFVVACAFAALPTILHAQEQQPAARIAIKRAVAVEAREVPAAEPAKADDAPRKDLPDENFLRSQRQQRDNARNQNAGTPDAGEASLEDLVQLSMDGDQLKLEAVGGAGGSGRTSQRYTIKGTKATITVSRSMSSAIALGNGMVRPASTSISLNRVDVGVTDDTTIWQASASQSSSYLSISGQSVLGRITFSQNNTTRAAAGVVRAQPVRVTVYEWQAGPRLKSVFTASADSIDKLRTQNPIEFRKHVVPLFRKFSDMSWMTPGASDAYGVFGEISADPQAVTKVQSLLPELDSDAFAVRESAAKQLLDLGPAGVLAALRMDADSLSDEQKGQLGRLIAAHRRRSIVNPEDARKETGFLTDCLEHPDLAVRTAAKASLERLAGKSLPFDPKLEGEALTAAADEIRKQVQELLPTTRPAEPEAAPAPGGVQIQPLPALIEPQILIK